MEKSRSLEAVHTTLYLIKNKKEHKSKTNNLLKIGC